MGFAWYPSNRIMDRRNGVAGLMLRLVKGWTMKRDETGNRIALVALIGATLIMSVYALLIALGVSGGA